MANLPATKGMANREKKMFGEMVVSNIALSYLIFLQDLYDKSNYTKAMHVNEKLLEVHPTHAGKFFIHY